MQHAVLHIAHKRFDSIIKLRDNRAHMDVKTFYEGSLVDRTDLPQARSFIHAFDKKFHKSLRREVSRHLSTDAIII